MNNNNIPLFKKLEYLYVLIFSCCLFPAILKFSNIFYVDLRFQEIISNDKISFSCKIVALGITLLMVVLSLELTKRNNISLKQSFMASLPLGGCCLMWFFSASLPLLILNIVLISCSWGRIVSLCNFSTLKQIKSSNAYFIVGSIIFLYAAVGAYWQCQALNTLALSWFDWGHFYECLNNFFHGKPFHLNLCNGSFLGSRFSPTLMVLLPIVATHNLPLFFFVSCFLVGSGAFFVYLITKEWKMTTNEGIMWSIWYLLIPTVANMNLSLLEGFHEVFLLFLLIPGAIWCYITKRYILVSILIILILGVRETTGILIAGYGIVLLINKKKVSGLILFFTGILYVIIVMKFLMVLFDPPVKGTYAHVGFFSHLGNNIVEIALSPFQKPAIFWGSLFNSHTIIFWCTLFLPFITLIGKSYILLIPAIVEFVMVSIDRRFDSQTVLRHYQVSIVIVLIISALCGAKKLRESYKNGILFYGIKGANIYKGHVTFAIVATICSFFFFVRYPGFPASNPQRRSFNNGNVSQLSDAQETVKRFKSLIPKGEKITVSPMFASALIPEYDIYFNFDENENTLQNYCLVENFSSFYFPEAKLSRYLTKSPNWQLVHQEYVDERSFQLFKRTNKPIKKNIPIIKLDDKKWALAGQTIPLPIKNVELKAIPVSQNHLRIGARIIQKCTNDIGFRTRIIFADKSVLNHFTSFCNGVYPADLANVGDVFFYIIETPVGKQVTSCSINVVEIKSHTTPL